jgi:dTDP-4-amino-4,6-dideoxygalactose transaminase
LKYVDRALTARKAIDATYAELLGSVKGIRCLNDAGAHVSNYAYFPILVEAGYPLSRDALCQKLKDNNVHPRRYFYPLISDFPMYRGLPSAHRENLPVATRAAQQILCLPIYPNLDMRVVEQVAHIIAAQ